MRVGTWNLEGKWTTEHEQFLVAPDCQVWLLTEVPATAHLPGYHRHLTEAQMLPGKHWSGIDSQAQIEPLPDPHLASSWWSAAEGGDAEHAAGREAQTTPSSAPTRRSVRPR